MYYSDEQLIEMAKRAEGYKGIPKGYSIFRCGWRVF